MKIPLQEKIAELEQRIVRLEERAEENGSLPALHRNKKIIRTSTHYSSGNGEMFGPHWRKMWEEFHLAMKEMFE